MLSIDKNQEIQKTSAAKTIAMLALRYFLVERERGRLSFNDFTLSHWPKIDQMGCSWVSAQKYSKITDCSKATATRDLAELLKIGAFRKLEGGGRSTRYDVDLKTD